MGNRIASGRDRKIERESGIDCGINKGNERK